MRAHQIRRKSVRRDRSLRGFLPALETCEARTLLTAGAFLQGTAFIDSNNNTVLDPGELGLSGATIKLYDATGTTLLGQTTTDTSGNYLFRDGNGTVFNDNLTPGTYQLVEVPPAGTPSYSVTGTQALWQIGPAPTVGPGVSTATVTIPDPSKVYVTGLSLSPYSSVQYVLLPLSPSAETVGLGTINVAVGSTPSVSAADLSGAFGTYCVAPTRDFDGGYPYHMIPAPASALLGPNAGRIAYLYNHYRDSAAADASGVSAAALQAAIFELVEDVVPDLSSGDFSVLSPSTPAAIVSKANFYLNDSAGKNELAMVLDATLGGTVPVAAQSLLATDSVNFANQAPKEPPFQNISISGVKYNDANGDGNTAGDTGLAGVTIDLFKDGGATPFATTVTGANGAYSFTDLGPGTYTVKEEVPSGWTQTVGSAGYTVVAQSGANSNGNDFANFQLISIAGTKYNDANGDGSSAGDLGLGGVTIDLFKDGGTTPAATTVTASDGSYSFTNLGPGTYTVKEEVPSGWLQTLGNAGYTVAAQSGVNSIGNNFANFELTRISGIKYNDVNGDGSTAGDPVLAGVTIDLFKDGGATPFATTVTGANGAYSFTNLGPGTYTVKEEVPSGWTQTFGAAGYTLAAQSGVNSTGNDFANFQLISISGVKYNDLNGDGSTVGDAGLGGVTIDLFKNGGTTPIATTVTGANGAYSFTNLGPGTYTVKEEVPSGWLQTLGSAGYSVTAQSGANSSGNDFANFQLISISGVKYNDLNGDGSTSDDPVLGGVTVDLFKDGGTAPVATTVTASDGSYSFTNLGPGAYTVKEEVPSGWAQTLGAAGYTVAAQSGTNSSGNDFANFQLISISGVKYNDLNGNGNTAGDPVLAGVTIDLFKDGGTTPVATTVTGTNGTYSFTNLGPGTYTVKEEVPGGWTQTVGVSGYTVAAQSGQNVGNQNFANFQNICISGVKYNDLNGNGNVTGDPGLAGVTIDLFKNGGTTPVATSVTGPNGAYSFTNLGPGTYTVKEEVPSGWLQTLGNAGYSVAAQSGLNSSGNNFANFQLISISGVKYNDLNGDGNTAGDAGLGGVTIKLFKNGGTSPVATTVTASDGSYAFTNLAPGSYTVQEVVPAGWVQTLGGPGTNGSYAVTAQSGQNVTDDNFANFQLICISGTKFKDVNANSQLDSGEPGLGGVTIKLFKNGGTTAVASTTTASNGSYSFTNLGPGTYSVQEIVPAGWGQTLGGPGPNGTYIVAAQSGKNAGNQNFGDVPIQTCACNLNGVTYTVTAPDGTTKVVNDLRGNTQQGSTVSVTFVVPAGQYDQLSLVSYKAVESFFNSDTADLQTVYQFVTGIYGPGSHTITVSLPDCFYQVDFVCGTVITQLGVDGNAFYSAQNRLISADNGGINACGQDPVAISGVVFCDANNNGIQNAGDEGLGGVTVTLTGTDAYGVSITATTKSDADGNYTFIGMPPSNSAGYKVTVSPPSGSYAGKAKVGSAGGALTGGTEGVSGIVLGNGTNAGNNYNFGILMTSSLSGLVYVDAHNSGQVELDDLGLAGITVKLSGTNSQGNSVNQTVTTDDDGQYLFTGLLPGTYTITVVQPGGVSGTQASVGTIDGATVGQVKSNSCIASITLTGWCAEGTNYNFGEQGSAVCRNQTAATTFWYSQKGQALIKAFDGGSTSKTLGNWLADVMPNLLGSLKGKTNAQVASYFSGLCNNSSQKANAQAMATALAVYATDSGLGGDVASQYGFAVTATGVATSTYNVAGNGAALGLVNNTSYCVLLLLEQVDALTDNGVIASSASNAAYNVFLAINKIGGIS